jgi:hypothetical protein
MLDRRSVACAFDILHMPNRDAVVLVAPAPVVHHLCPGPFRQYLY